MLPRGNRLTKPADFRRSIRAGRVARTSTVIVHGLMARGEAEYPQEARGPKVGMTVSKAVGGSVTRHKVARVIRHAMRDVLSELPEGSTWVIRALPAAGAVGAGQRIRDDVRAGIDEILRKRT